jgi:glyceraldehyde 3-phosphate dehydrogenase
VYGKDVQAGEGEILVAGQKIKMLQEKDPVNLPWRELGVEMVLECSGVFTDFEGAKKHLSAGAKKVIISAPSKSLEVPTFVLGVNDKEYDGQTAIVSMASCTTNCLAPVAKVLHDNFKIIQGLMTTSHSYTNDQKILDLAHKDLRRARAAAVNIIPTSTGAASAIGKVIPDLAGKLDGLALRVPTSTVSVLDLVCQVEKEVSAQEINQAFIKASQKELKGILAVETDPLVSSDFKGNPLSAIVDVSLTMAKGKMIKVVAWYDNEWAYACRLAEFAQKII